MRILKYIFLLLLLSLVALSIFVATQKGQFEVERTKVINSPKSSVFSYVNDLNNWGEWNSLAVEDSLINITLSKKTIGKGSLCTWEGNKGDGDILTLNLIENASITYKMHLNGNSADAVISFKDTIGGTKISWKAKGKMNFINKLLNSFNGGAEKTFGILFEKSLSNLDKNLNYEINTYSIKVDGLTNRPEVFYLAQTFNSNFSKVSKNAGIVVSKITAFCKTNNIIINGKPFIIYHTYDKINQLTNISICIPIKDPIFITEGSDISSKKLKAFQGVKMTLMGDHIHSNKALDKLDDYIKTNHLTKDTDFSHVEVFNIGKNVVKNPSQWITEFYYPIASKVTSKPAIASARDSITIKEQPILKTVPSIKTVTPVKNKNEIPSEF